MPSKDPQDDDLIGQTIEDRYRIISWLGAGGMGVTYRVWDEKAGVPVVIKIPKRVFFEDPKFAERFYREIQLLQGLFHPHIVPILGVGVHDAVPYVAMRFLPGGSLSDRRLRDGQGKPRANPAPMLHLWLPAVAEALDYVHAQGVVHRDVKPANIFFDAFWGAFLGDFGIAKIVEESETFDKEHTLTATHMGIGTAEYMSPEQFTPKTVIDGRADQYALAVMVYELLAGVRPFTGATAHLIVEVTTLPAPPLQSKGRDIPKSLVEAVHKGLAKNPSDRFATCREFAAVVLRDVPPMEDEPGVARLLCPKCSKILTLPTHAAGQKGRCPKCHTSMKVADDLGALWLLDEARRQRVSQPLFEIDASEPEPVDKEMLSEDIEDFRPVSTPSVIGTRYRKGQKTPPWLIPVGIAAALLLIIVLARMSGGSGGRSQVPRPVTYEQQLDAAIKKLKTSPEDSEANDFVGRHWCFREQNWVRGLPFLAKSHTPSLSFLSQQEIDIRNTKTINSRRLIGAARDWWSFSERPASNTAEASAAIKKHAADIYRKHVESLETKADIAFANAWLDCEPEFQGLVGNKRPPDPKASTQKPKAYEQVIEASEYEQLVGASTLNKTQAEALVASAKRSSIALNRLTVLTPEVAKELAKFRGHSISLNRLASIDLEAARCLAAFTFGEGSGELSLNGLTSISPDVARALSLFKGHWLYLNGVTTLTPEAAYRLAAFDGTNRYLNGVTTISIDTARAISGFKCFCLNLAGLAILTPEVAEAIAVCRSNVAIGLTELSPETATKLVSAAGILSFPKIAVLSPEVVHILARKKRGGLSLDRVSSLSPESARALASCQASSLSLLGLQTLLPESAKAIAEFKGRLYLCVTNQLSDSVVQALLGFQGESLSFPHGIQLPEARKKALLTNPRVRID